MLFSEMISFQVFLVQIKRRALGTTIILFFFLASNMMIKYSISWQYSSFCGGVVFMVYAFQTSHHEDRVKMLNP